MHEHEVPIILRSICGAEKTAKLAVRISEHRLAVYISTVCS